MNYFPFYADPLLSAQFLDDRRLRRCFQEAVMTLAEVQREWQPLLSNPYPLSMPMPPKLMAWLLEGAQERLSNNLVWFMRWTHALLITNVRRFGNDKVDDWVATVKYYALWLRAWTCEQPDALPRNFINLACSKAKGLDFTHIPDTHEAYRAYVRFQWDNTDKYAPKFTPEIPFQKDPAMTGMHAGNALAAHDTV